MKARTAGNICMLLFSCAITACSQWRYDLGTPLDSARLPQQDTPLGLVLDQLGPPLRVSATDSGLVLAYEHWHIREEAIGFSLGALGAEFLSVDWGEMRVKGEFLLLTFDKQHLLSSATHSEWDNYGGGGQAVQPFFGFVSVVDADGLLDSMPQHRWGGALMQGRLAASLNRHSNPDTGHGGLQQRGTPTAVGQQSLGRN
jgi:hypothetical protein